MSRLSSRPVKPVADSWLKWLSSTPDAFDDAGWPVDTPEWSDTLPCARLIDLPETGDGVFRRVDARRTAEAA